MRTRKQKFETVVSSAPVVVEKLHCYASGDGSLSFNWASGVHPYPSINRPVLRGEVEQYVKEHPHLLENFSVSDQYGHFHLIPNVTRRDKNHLQYKGEVYEVRAQWFRGSDNRRRLSRHDTKILFTYEWGETVQVKNLSIRAGICYFLEHEKELYYTHKHRGEKTIRKLFAQSCIANSKSENFEAFKQKVEEGYQLMKILYRLDFGVKYKE